MNQGAMKCLAPGAVLGMLGAGQLGRMFAVAARQAGYRVAVFGGGPDSPCGQVSDFCFDKSFADSAALEEFAAVVDVVSYEYENIPLDAVKFLEQRVPVYPDSNLLQTAQHRLLEKRAMRSIGIPTADFVAVNSAEDLQAGLSEFGGEGILKTATLGYDGKGQQRLDSSCDVQQVYASFNGVELILESIVPFELELSIVACGFADGTRKFFTPSVNHHVNHILDCSVAPAAQLSTELVQRAEQIAAAILDHFQVIGVLCVEFFMTADQQLLVNEIAPRPHNSGHLTIESTAASQFEQQFRAVSGLPSGNVRPLRPAVMLNLLGDHLEHATADAWREVFGLEDVHVHMYGKQEARRGRKMGHLTVLDDVLENAEKRARQARRILGWTGE